MFCYWRRFIWIVPGLRLPRRRSTPTLHPRWPSHRLLRRLACPMAEMVAPVATETRTTTKTAIAVMAAATTPIAAEVVVALLARPPPPLVSMVGPTHRGRPMATRGKGTRLCTPALCPLDSSVRGPSWPHRASMCLPASCPGHSSNSSSRCTSRLPRPQAGTPGSAQAGTNSRWPTPSAPWRSTRPLPRSRTGWRTPA
jgi:hypothetical protein